jgi:hypothetical protein
MNICLPAKSYFIVTIICCIWYYTYFSNTYKYNSKLFFIDLSQDILALVFFTWLLNYLCITNYKNTSWFLFIIYLIMSISVIYIVKKEKLSYFEFTGNQV